MTANVQSSRSGRVSPPTVTSLVLKHDTGEGGAMGYPQRNG